MKKIKRIFALLVSLVMVFAAAGCGNSGNNSGKSDASGNHIYDKFPSYDMEGRTIKIGSHYDLGYNTPVKELTPEQKQNRLYKMNYYDNLKRVAEKYNVQLEVVVVPWDRYISTLTTSVLSGSPFVDIAHLGADLYYPVVAGGFLQPVSAYTSEISDVNTDEKALFKLPAVAGEESYAVARKIYADAFMTYLGYNQDIFDALGVETPLSLYEKGEWTWDNFLRLAKETTRDTDGDGQNNYWGYSGVYLGNMLMPTNDASLVDSVNKKEKFTSKNVIETIDFAKNFYREKYVYQLDNNPFEYQNTELFRDGISAMFGLYGHLVCNRSDAVPFEFHVVPFPTGPSNESGSVMGIAPEAFAIPNGVKDADKVYQILEELHLWFDQDDILMQQGVVEYLETGLQTQEDIDRVLDMSSKWMLDYSFNIEEVNRIWVNVGRSSIEGKSVSTLVESNKQIAQDMIDQFFKKEDK